MDDAGGIGALAVRALIRRELLAQKGVIGVNCDGTCDGRPESHDADDVVEVYTGPRSDLDNGEGDPALWAKGLPLWPGGERGTFCGSWAARSRFLADAMHATRWVTAGQSVGALDALPPSMSEAVMTAREEWEAIRAEAMKGDR